MNIATNDIVGMNINRLEFTPKKAGTIYVTLRHIKHYIDENENDYFRIDLDENHKLLFKINHVSLHDYFKTQISFLELVQATPNGTIYYITPSKTVLSTSNTISKPIIKLLKFTHQSEQLSPYGRKILQLNEVCASFNF